MARTFGALLGSQIGTRAIRFVYVIVLARLIDPAELGIYLYGIAIYVALFGLAGFGQGLLLAARVPHRTAVGAWFAHSLTIRLAATAVAGLVGLLFIWTQESDPLARITATWFIGALVARSLAAWVREAHIALEDAAWIPRYEAGFRATEALLGVAFVLDGLSVVWLAALHCAVWGAEAAASARLMARRGRWPACIGHRWRFLRRMAGASFWHMASVGLIVVFGQAAVVGSRLLDTSSAAVGQFAIAVQGLLTLILIPSTLAMALGPALSRARRSGTGDDQRAVTALMRSIFAAGAVVAVLIEGYGTPLVHFVLGPRYAEAADLFTALAWAVGPYAAAIVAVQALNALGRKRQAAMVAAIMALSQPALLVIVHPWLGIAAGCAAMIAGAGLGSMIGSVLVGIAVGIRGFAWWLAPLAVTAVAAALMRFVPVDAAILAPLVLVALLAAFAATRVIARTELAYIVGRFGRNASQTDGRALL
jgi:O-antigen/teichoic acid export membrane protein